MNVVVAMDSFKGSVSAPVATAAVAAGIRAAVPSASVAQAPMADGGEGTADILGNLHDAQSVTVRTTGPLGDPLEAVFRRAGSRVWCDIAAASGLGLLGTTGGALRASTTGTGHLLRRALDEGATELVVCLGGSGTTDGGTGLLDALGVRFRDARGRRLAPGGDALGELTTIDVTGLLPAARQARWTALCDVTNPLAGPRGAAHVFGPQKGVAPSDVDRLDRGLRRLGTVLGTVAGVDVTRLPGAGAAGGAGAALRAVLGAELISGAEHVATRVLSADLLRRCDLLITGEGSFDSQSLDGKVVGYLLERAAAQGVPAVVVAGRVDLDPERRRQVAAAGVWSIATGPATLAQLRREAPRLLARAGGEVAHLVAVALDRRSPAGPHGS
jgi:glycerate 2-kinase